MATAANQIISEFEEPTREYSPHELISLLLNGALARIDQAKTTLHEGDSEAAGVLMAKVVGIVNGLRASLDLENGGEIAGNLDALYNYISSRLCEAEEDTGESILMEASNLLNEVKTGWDGIAD